MTQTPRRRWDVEPWPWPGDTREDKAKRVALSYRQLVFDIAQGRSDDPAGDLHRLDEHWARYGAFWPRPSAIPVATEGEDWYSAVDVAHLIDKTPRDIYRWAQRGHIEQRTGPDGAPEYSLTSARRYQQQRRQRRKA